MSISEFVLNTGMLVVLIWAYFHITGCSNMSVSPEDCHKYGCILFIHPDINNKVVAPIAT